MAEWIKCTDKMPDNDNPLTNQCFVRTKWNNVVVAYWSKQLQVWRRIATPVTNQTTEVIDEIIQPDDITDWIYMDDVFKIESKDCSCHQDT